MTRMRKGNGPRLLMAAAMALLLWGATVQAASWSLMNDPQGDLVSASEREEARRRAEEEAQLKRIRALATKEKAEAEQLATKEKAEAERLAAARRAAERAELERLQAMAAREQADADAARRAAEQADRQAAEQTELERLQAMAAIKRTETLQAGQTQPEPGQNQTPVVASTRPVGVTMPEPGARPLATAAQTLPGKTDYRIGPGDALDIYVWKDEALTRSVVVSPDGRFSFPLVGEMAAEGKTVSQLKQELEEKVSRFVPDPVLSVEVRQANSMLVYVLGRVNSPGRFLLNDEINVLQALAMAGGLNPFADRSGIKVLRQEDGRTQTFAFHYNKVVKGKKLEENIRLQRGDVIVVP